MSNSHSSDGRVSLHSLHRSLGDLAINLHRDREARNREEEPNRLEETHLQFQVPVSGWANYTHWDGATQVVALDFTHAFHVLPGLRDNPASEPHVSWGSVMETRTPVTFSVHVIEWNRDDNEAYIGAKLAVHVISPVASPGSPVQFRGRIHVTFQGYGAPQMSESE